MRRFHHTFVDRMTCQVFLSFVISTLISFTHLCQSNSSVRLKFVNFNRTKDEHRNMEHIKRCHYFEMCTEQRRWRQKKHIAYIKLKLNFICRLRHGYASMWNYFLFFISVNVPNLFGFFLLCNSMNVWMWDECVRYELDVVVFFSGNTKETIPSLYYVVAKKRTVVKALIVRLNFSLKTFNSIHIYG